MMNWERQCFLFIRGEGVDVSNVKIHSENPTGIYFKEFRRAGEIKVQYYRKDSAASQMSIDDINFNYIEKAKFLHVTGITRL
ncbi:PfkB family carbohydrate kinase [Sinobaca sp. H24]|uniref:PfkB family carbohydrate kinase n=1 Tax=Sinobaca sp. H24 TaxID=2923376 RepID=UPI0027E2262F|nr:PfkB family carbohydrate kinase [Sinobaca sp. H24]